MPLWSNGSYKLILSSTQFVGPGKVWRKALKELAFIKLFQTIQMDVLKIPADERNQFWLRCITLFKRLQWPQTKCYTKKNLDSFFMSYHKVWSVLFWVFQNPPYDWLKTANQKFQLFPYPSIKWLTETLKPVDPMQDSLHHFLPLHVTTRFWVSV